VKGKHCSVTLLDYDLGRLSQELVILIEQLLVHLRLRSGSELDLSLLAVYLNRLNFLHDCRR